MNTTEATPGDATAEPRETNPPTPGPDAPAASAGATPDMPTDANADGGPQAQPGDGPPRPRRRRRRRRKPIPGMMTTGPAVAGEAPVSEPPAGDGTLPDPNGGGTAGEVGAEGDTPRAILRLRSRRRRRRPHAPGLAPGLAEPAAEGATEGATAPEGATPAANTFRVPRRRRRQAPLSTAPSTEAGDATAPGGEGTPGTARPPRSRNRRRRSAAPNQGASGVAGERQPREQGAPGPRAPGSRERREGPPQHTGERRESRRDAGPRADRGDRGRDGQRGGGPGRGRGGGPPRQVERKLYSTDAIVDRGFEDVEEEGDTRRVHWTIVKRTTADQISRKAIAATYVLQRDGQDTEFPSLGAARSAVNKTIVHPEKLTLSKAEHAAAKK